MKKNRVITIIAIVIIVTLLSIALCGCKLKAEDCYVFGEEEFVELKKEDNSKLDENCFRIMSANVLVHIADWGGEPVKPRAHRFAEAVKHYAPDVIGMQEMCSDWYKYLLPQLSDYEVIEKKNSVFMENRSAIIYNKSKLTLIASGLKKYSKGDKNGCRAITYGVFERKSDNKKLIVTSTHLNLIRMKDYEKEKSIMLSQVDELIECIDMLKSTYPNMPIFMTGDYNSMEHENSRFTGDIYSQENDLTYFKCYGKPCGSFAYEKLITKFTDCKFVDNIQKLCDNTRGYLYDDPTWDHIFMSNNHLAEVLTFRVLSSDYFHNNEDRTSRISDHLPICVDVLVKN